MDKDVVYSGQQYNGNYVIFRKMGDGWNWINQVQKTKSKAKQNPPDPGRQTSVSLACGI